MSTDPQSLDGLRLDRSEETSVAPRGGRWKWVLGVLLLGVVAVWWFRPRTVEVRTFVVTATDPAEKRTLLNSSGYVTARRAATVSSKITGKVIEVRFEEGQHVEEGEVLARLDDTNADTYLRLAEAQVAATKSGLAETRVRLDVALRELERVHQLEATGISTEADLDAARGEVDSLKAHLELQTEEVGVAERQQAVYARQLEDTIIRAPFTGVVTTKDAQPGEMISPVSAGGGYTRTGIGTIVDMASLEIEVDVNESYLGRVSEHQAVAASLDAYPDWRIPAHVIAIIPTADRQKSTVKVRVGFDELDPRILPEMAVRVAFLGPPPSALDGAPALFVPTRAVVHEGGQAKVWLVTEDRAVVRDVAVGEVLDGETAVLAGLTPGDRVIIEGQDQLLEGGRVRERTQ
ncbi:MAG: efflux RND transporter periplasmic adaptor subunit [Verrucomicrobiales bacterium]|nr:efflux RND transporter periplasmic adaptor subunit [Verrucomicrobiales bacterium]